MADAKPPDPPPKLLQVFLVVNGDQARMQASIELNQLVHRKQVSVSVLETYCMGRVCSQHGCLIDSQLIEVRLLDGYKMETDTGALLTVAKHSGGSEPNPGGYAFTLIVMHEHVSGCHAWPEARARAREWWRKTSDQRIVHKLKLEENYKERNKTGGHHVSSN